ncbi:MAG: 16S rRNA (guanine(527)-N(7))-methyltransferase RsmG [Oscillospiraceae bacterium]|jgi:16S rRNA (guanine(527)-N(7))-methyltransferase RsmG|nr:16S rRNA (guanine(527)-N(7))-methyltransferase RsmG [Oscillospiraceae bacterium]
MTHPSPLFPLYEQILLRENAKYNLTAITDPAAIRQKHFADSLALLGDAPCPLPPGASLLDVGSGGGFPGVPLKIARPDLRVTLLEATGKKADFLALLAAELGLEVSVVNARAEAAAHDPRYREQFDAVAARAVAALPVLCEFCLPFVRPGGVFVAYKGPGEKAREEIGAARRAIELLGGELERVCSEATVYGGRSRIILRKISQTSADYPRNHGAMRKNPL